MTILLTQEDLLKTCKDKDMDDLKASDFMGWQGTFDRAARIEYNHKGFKRVLKDRYNGPSPATEI